MIDRLGKRYNVQNESVFLLAGGITPAYAARINCAADSKAVPSHGRRAPLSFHVSLLGPYYGIHDMGEPDEKSAEIAAEIEATYPGYQQIPPEIGNEVVPGIAAEGASFDTTTIYLCLFSEVWKWVEPPQVQFEAWQSLNV